MNTVSTPRSECCNSKVYFTAVANTGNLKPDVGNGWYSCYKCGNACDTKPEPVSTPKPLVKREKWQKPGMFTSANDNWKTWKRIRNTISDKGKM